MRVPAFHEMPVIVPDEAPRAFAERLARIIVAKWRDCGHGTVAAWVEPRRITTKTKTGEDRVSDIFEIKSNLVNGLPPARLAAAAE